MSARDEKGGSSQARHTYASMVLSADEHPIWVAKQMGHTDRTMIANIYGRWMPSTADKAEILFSGKLKQEIIRQDGV